MIGKVYLSAVDFYDIKTRTTKRKIRPVLIVAGPQENDYIVLPISTITMRNNLNAYYDLLISPPKRAVLNLSRECFIRTHKQLPVHSASLVKQLGDMRADAPDLYLDAIAKMEEIQKAIVTFSI